MTRSRNEPNLYIFISLSPLFYLQLFLFPFERTIDHETYRPVGNFRHIADSNPADPHRRTYESILSNTPDIK